MSTTEAHYYVPAQSHWPIVGSVALATTVIGAANLIHCSADKLCTVGASWSDFISFNSDYSVYLMTVGFALIVYLLFGWFGNVIRENLQGLYSQQLDRSFRWGMVWFIFSEVMFFAAFFGALFYARNFSVPWMAGEGAKTLTHTLLWPNFEGVWPLINNPNPELFSDPYRFMPAWGLPALNTLILLTSSLTVTWAHWGILQKNQIKTILGLAATVALGSLFLYFQVVEYTEAYHEMNLKLSSGIYGSTFFMLTGFHGLHVTIGTLMLTVMLFRAIKGHFKPTDHFGFEAAAWYWHFVDVVWLGLFIFVYCL